MLSVIFITRSFVGWWMCLFHLDWFSFRLFLQFFQIVNGHILPFLGFWESYYLVLNHGMLCRPQFLELILQTKDLQVRSVSLDLFILKFLIKTSLCSSPAGRSLLSVFIALISVSITLGDLVRAFI